MGAILNSYDIVLSSCGADVSFGRKLGFEGIGVVGNGIVAVNADDPNAKVPEGRAIAFGSAENMSALVRKGIAGVCISGYKIDRKLIEDMSANDCILCISTKEITNSYGIRRAKAIYRASKLFRLAKKRKIRVAFATMASSTGEMLSKIQLIEIAKLIGAEEQYARYSISEINRYIVEGEER